MIQPAAVFRLPDGELVDVGAGGIIGRLASAALFLDDPRVSEAHAMVSLRGGRLFLISLRRPLLLRGQPVAQTRVKAGLVVELVPGLELVCVELRLPPSSLAITVSPGGAGASQDVDTVPLVASRYSVCSDGTVARGYRTDAIGWIWAASGGVRLRMGEGEARWLEAGETIEVAGRRLQVVAVPLSSAGVDATVEALSMQAELTVVLRHTTVHVHASDGANLQVSGLPARILGELAAYAAPVPWELAARTIWPPEASADRYLLRQNWDRNLRSLRAKLKTAGLRTDLVKPDGCGNVELYLLPGDTIVDEA